MRYHTNQVLADVARERERQIKLHGHNYDIEDGTGPDVLWLADTGPALAGQPACVIEERFRAEYERFESKHGKPDWVRLLREEVAEALTESDPERLRDELIQVAAVAVSWCEKIDQRRA